MIVVIYSPLIYISKWGQNSQSQYVQTGLLCAAVAKLGKPITDCTYLCKVTEGLPLLIRYVGVVCLNNNDKK